MSTHVCPTPGCSRRVPDRLLMCVADWALVPDELQRAVYRAYRRGSGVGSDALAEAQARVIEAVAETKKVREFPRSVGA